MTHRLITAAAKEPTVSKHIAPHADIVPLAERLLAQHGDGSALGILSARVLLSVLSGALLDAGDQSVVDVSDKIGKDLDGDVRGNGSGNLRSRLRNRNADLNAGHAHGLIPPVKGSDKSAPAVRTRRGRRLSTKSKRVRK